MPHRPGRYLVRSDLRWGKCDKERNNDLWQTAKTTRPPAGTPTRCAGQQTQRKQRKKMRRTRFWAIYCAGVVLASCLLAGLGWLIVNDVCALNKAPLTATVEIEKGDSVGRSPPS